MMLDYTYVQCNAQRRVCMHAHGYCTRAHTLPSTQSTRHYASLLVLEHCFRCCVTTLLELLDYL